MARAPLLVALLLGCTASHPAQQATIEPLPTPPPHAPIEETVHIVSPTSSVVVLTSGLEMEDLRPGAGPEAQPGSEVVVHYVGTLVNGTEFDSSRKRGTPFVFHLGAGHVIKGWDEGVAGMRVGQIRRLSIPPDLGYGARGVPPTIPAGSTLIFEIELLEIRP